MQGMQIMIYNLRARQARQNSFYNEDHDVRLHYNETV